MDPKYTFHSVTIHIFSLIWHAKICSSLVGSTLKKIQQLQLFLLQTILKERWIYEIIVASLIDWMANNEYMKISWY